MTSDSNTPNARTQEENTIQQRLAADDNGAETETAQAKKKRWIADTFHCISDRRNDPLHSADADILLELIYDIFSSLEKFDQVNFCIRGDRIGSRKGWWWSWYIEAKTDSDGKIVDLVFNGLPKTLKRINIDPLFPFEELEKFPDLQRVEIHLNKINSFFVQDSFEHISEGFHLPLTVEEVHVRADEQIPVIEFSRFFNGLPKTLKRISIDTSRSFSIELLARFSCLKHIELHNCSRALFEAENVPENFRFPSSLKTVKIMGSRFLSLSRFLNTLPKTLRELCFKGIPVTVGSAQEEDLILEQTEIIIRCLRYDDMVFPDLTRLEITDFKLKASDLQTLLLDICPRFLKLRELDVHNNEIGSFRESNPGFLERLARAQTDDGRINTNLRLLDLYGNPFCTNFFAVEEVKAVALALLKAFKGIVCLGGSLAQHISFVLQYDEDIEKALRRNLVGRPFEDPGGASGSLPSNEKLTPLLLERVYKHSADIYLHREHQDGIGLVSRSFAGNDWIEIEEINDERCATGVFHAIKTNPTIVEFYKRIEGREEDNCMENKLKDGGDNSFTGPNE